MIVFSDNKGVKSSIGYKEFAKNYLEYYGFLDENEFVVNVILLLDDWEKEKAIKFDRIMPSDWNLLLKAVKVLNVDQSILSN